MTTTRERLDRRNRAARVLVVVLGAILAPSLVAAALGLWLLPPILAESPRERFSAATRITLRTDAAIPAVSATAGDGPGPDATPALTPSRTPSPTPTMTASASLGAGWLALGVGPFLDPSTAAFLSPDDAYRADLALLPLREGGPDVALVAYLADHDLTSAASGAAWSGETLPSGLTVRYADVTRGADTITVAMIELPAGADADADADAPAVLVLRATVDSDDAARYRPVTADLAASVTLTMTGATS